MLCAHGGNNLCILYCWGDGSSAKTSPPLWCPAISVGDRRVLRMATLYVALCTIKMSGCIQIISSLKMQVWWFYLQILPSVYSSWKIISREDCNLEQTLKRAHVGDLNGTKTFRDLTRQSVRASCGLSLTKINWTYLYLTARKLNHFYRVPNVYAVHICFFS